MPISMTLEANPHAVVVEVHHADLVRKIFLVPTDGYYKKIKLKHFEI